MTIFRASLGLQVGPNRTVERVEAGVIRRPLLWADKVERLDAAPLLHDLPFMIPFMSRCRILLHDERLFQDARAASEAKLFPKHLPSKF